MVWFEAEEGLGVEVARSVCCILASYKSNVYI